jgi:hypothetical protein
MLNAIPFLGVTWSYCCCRLTSTSMVRHLGDNDNTSGKVGTPLVSSNVCALG